MHISVTDTSSLQKDAFMRGLAKRLGAHVLCVTDRFGRLRNQIVNHMPMDIRQAAVDPVVTHGESFVIDA